MNTIIAGAGVVGTALAQQLSNEGHRVTLIDQDRSLLRDMQDRLDVLTLAGNASMPSTLKKAGADQAQMVIAVTSVDEVNLVVGMIANRMGIKTSIVRLRNPEYSGQSCVLPPSELGIDQIINPEPAIVDAIVRMIDIPGATDVATLADDQILMLGFDVDEDSPVAGRTPAELREAGDLDAFLVLYIRRGDTVIVPRGNDRIEPGDNVHLLVSAALVDFIVPVLHRRPPEVKRVVIVGGSRI
ncbi:MAG: NAD-binding protein, partial [Myxococcota bacterium]